VFVGAYNPNPPLSPHDIIVLSSTGQTLKLNCEGQPRPDQQFLLSPDRRKLWLRFDGRYNVTSWLHEGVFALPDTFEDLRIRHGFRWINDDYLLGVGTRQDETTNDVVDRALIVVRWDGTDARRLNTETIADNSDNSLEWLGDTKTYGVYQIDVEPDVPGFDYYRVDFADWSTSLIASGTGGGWVSVFGQFNPVTEQLIYAGDGNGIDSLFAIDVGTMMLRPLNGHVGGTQAFVTADGEYVYWGTPSAWSALSLTRDDATTVTYDQINRDALLTYQPNGHAVATTTAETRQLFFANPETGQAGVIEHEAVAADAPGVSSKLVASDAGQVFFTMATTAGGPYGLYVGTLDEPAVLLSEPGRSTRLDEYSQSAKHIVFGDGEALYAVDLESNVAKIASTDGAERGSPIGWSSAEKRVVLHVHVGGVDGILLWTVGEPTVTDLRNATTDALGELSVGWSFSLLR
jgi:hypothetical protein